MFTQLVRNRSAQLLLLGVLLIVQAAPLPAQVPAKSAYRTVMTEALREISKDPCHASGKIPAMMPAIIAAAKESRAGVDDVPDMLKRTADRGCANLQLTIPKLELLLIAGKQGMLDACTYSPGIDYTAELAMARVNYSPLGVGIYHQDFQVPCMAEFVAAILTGQAVSRNSSTQPEALPAPGAPASRRRN